MMSNRYKLVQEERDAYILLQGNLSSQLRKVIKEKDVLNNGIESFQKRIQSTLDQLRTFLVRNLLYTARDTESMDIDECLAHIGRACGLAKDSEVYANRNILASRLQAAVNAETVMRQSQELSRAESKLETVHNQLAEMTQCMERERRGRIESEAAVVEAKFVATQALKALEKSHIELGIVSEERRKLADQRKVLLKEIKLSRNAFEEVGVGYDQLLLLFFYRITCLQHHSSSST